MNKKVLVAAVGAALMAGALAAKAEVTVYGKVHVSADYVDQDQPGVSESFGVSSNASRLGFKGSEDLGGGMKAVFQYESGIDATNDGGPGGSATTGGLSSRNRFVGLSGGFGTIVGGVYDAPIKSVGRSVELFPEYIGDARNITGVGGIENRNPNSITYTAPKLGPVAIQAQYSAQTSSATGLDNTDLDAWGANANATFGVVRVGVGYQSLNTNNTEKENALRAVADAKFGAIRVVGLWQTTSDVAGVSGADQDAYGVGAAFTMGNNVLKAQWYTRDKTDGQTTENGADMWVLGWDYKFSKKVTAYVAYASTDNDAAGTFSTQGNIGYHGDAFTAAAGTNPTALSVGMIMDF